MSDESFTINITKRDKVYISIICCLVILCLCLAIVLPRPYKIVEVEKPVYEKAYQKVYDTKKIYLISETSSLYDGGIGGYADGLGNFYSTEFKGSYIDTGNIRSAKVSVKVLEAGIETKKTLELNEYLTSLMINSSINEFGTTITIDSSFMDNINLLFVQALGESKSNPQDNYLFELEFERAVVNIVANFIGE